MRNDGKISKTEMGRPRQQMTRLVDGWQESVREHIWKLIAYWGDRPRDIDSWLTTLNAFIKRARDFNVKPGGNGYNMSMAQLTRAITDISFDGAGDAEVLAGRWHNEGFPRVLPDNLEKLRHQCIDLSNRLCALIMMDAGPLLTRADVEIARSRGV